MRTWRARVLALALSGIVALLAGCGSSSGASGGLNVSLGLAGSTIDHPAPPPSIAASGPAGTYAFVYDNQVWLRANGQAAPKQITRLVLSNGAAIAWGPLVWSPSGRYIAFAVVQDMNVASGSAPRTSGPLYYVDTTTCSPYCAIFQTGGTGSIYGHSYAWFGEAGLVFANGGGVSLYTLENPRVWALRAPASSAFGATSFFSFGDVALYKGTLYYTRMEIHSPNQSGAVGSASLMQTSLGSPDDVTHASSEQLANRFSPDAVSAGFEVASLGKVYLNPDGQLVAGAWTLSHPGYQTILAVQRIESVDTKAGQVTGSMCIIQYSGSTCDIQVLAKAAVQPWTAHPQLALSSANKAAFSGDALYTQEAPDKLGPAGWPTPPAWSPDGQTVAVTQLISQATDPTGVTRSQTSIVVYPKGQATGSALIAGGQGLVWSPAT